MISLALAVLLHFQDPIGDAVGNGSLQPPTAAIYRDLAALDINAFTLYDTATLSFALSFVQLDNPYGLPNGFSLPIIELYFEDTKASAGSTTLLPGSMMSLPAGRSWHYAVKLTGDAALLYQGFNDEPPIELGSTHSILLELDTTTLMVTTSLPRPESLRIYGMVGNYTAFNETGWQSISSSPSPWAYSSETQTRPVVDVLTSSFEAQQQAIDTGILPPMQVTQSSSTWQILMVAGLLIAVLGVFARHFWRRPAPAIAPGPNKAEGTELVTPEADMPDINVELSIFDKDLPEIQKQDEQQVQPENQVQSEDLPEVIDVRSETTANSSPKHDLSQPAEASPDTVSLADPNISEVSSNQQQDSADTTADSLKDKLEQDAIDVYSLKTKPKLIAAQQLDFKQSDWSESEDTLSWKTSDSEKSSG